MGFKNHTHLSPDLIIFKNNATLLLISAFPFGRQSHGHHLILASKKKKKTLVRISLSYLAWIEIRRYFIDFAQDHTILRYLKFLLSVEPHKVITIQNLMDRISEFLSKFIVDNESDSSQFPS